MSRKNAPQQLGFTWTWLKGPILDPRRWALHGLFPKCGQDVMTELVVSAQQDKDKSRLPYHSYCGSRKIPLQCDFPPLSFFLF